MILYKFFIKNLVIIMKADFYNQNKLNKEKQAVYL